MSRGDASTAFIRNMMTALERGCFEFTTSHSNAVVQLCYLLHATQLIADFSEIDHGKYKTIKVAIGCDDKHQPLIKEIIPVSNGGSPVYIKAPEVERLAKMSGRIDILHSSEAHGLVTAQEAAKNKHGGKHTMMIRLNS